MQTRTRSRESIVTRKRGSVSFQTKGLDPKLFLFDETKIFQPKLGNYHKTLEQYKSKLEKIQVEINASKSQINHN